MADPTSTITRNYQTDTDRATFVIKDAEALTVGGHVSIDESAGTVEFSGTDAHIPAGFVLDASTGIKSDLTGDSGGTKKAVVRGGIDVEVSVTGVTGITDIGSQVFATDGQTFSLTDPSAVIPCGYVKGHVSGTTALVHFYSYNEAKLKLPNT